MDSVSKYLRWGTLTGLFLIPFVPFVISTSMFFPFITGKTFVFRILVEIILALYLILALREPSYRPKASWMLFAVLAFVLSAGIATVLSVDVLKSFWSNFERMEGYLGVLHMGAYFLVLGAMLGAEKLWERFFSVSIGASALMGIYGLFQLFGVITINQGGVRLDGTFGNATYLAVYMLIHIFLTAFMALRHRGARWVYGLYAGAMILQLAALYYTATRGAILGVIGGIVLTAILIALFGREHKVLRTWALGTLGAAVLLIGGFLAIRDTEMVRQSPVLTRFAEISPTERTVSARFLVWGMALQGVAEKPLFGWGQENFNFVFNKYYTPEMYAQEAWFDRAHNSFLDWMVAGGAVTFLIYLSLFALLISALWRVPGFSVAERSVLTGLVAAYAFHLMFVFDNLVSSIYFFTLLAYAHHIRRRELPGRLELMGSLKGGAFVGAAAAVVLIVGAGAYYFNVPGIARAQTLLQAIIPQKEMNGSVVAKDPLENLMQFKEAYAGTVSLGRQEVVEQALTFAATLARTQGVNPQAVTDMTAFAIETGDALLAQRAGDARLELFTGSFYNALRRYDEALVHLDRALQASPRKQGILFEKGVNTYLNTGDYAKGMDVLKEAFDLEPRYDEARVLYAIALYYGGKQAEADALIMERYGTLAVDDSRILRTYFDLKLYDRVIAIWEKRALANPTDLQVKVSLAATHLAAGNRQKAIEILEEAIALDPRFEQDGRRFIEEIRAGRNP